MIDMDGLLQIISAIMPLLTGVLGAGATLFGLNLNNRWQNRRDINSLRSASVSKLFEYINESERNVLKMKLSIEDGKGINDALEASMLSMKSLQKEYDKSAVYLPNSIAQIVESMLNTVATINALALMDNQQATLKEIMAVEDNIKLYKKELRNVFQLMIGIKK